MKYFPNEKLKIELYIKYDKDFKDRDFKEYTRLVRRITRLIADFAKLNKG